MGHLGGLFPLTVPLICFHIWSAAGHALPVCPEQLDFRCSDGSCIATRSVCDGHAHCEDGSDERGCGRPPCEEEEEFSCRSGVCIARRFLCDGVDDCGDGSDEASCLNCSSFSCGPSAACLPAEQLCDGRSDCTDGRDEAPELCPAPSSPACSPAEFRCGDGRCIQRSWRCDHADDCADGSDEERCDQDECQVNNGGCSHLCMDLPMGFFCYCPDNMTLVGEHQCEDVDLCLQSDVCDQLCVHNNHSLACDCDADYQPSSASGGCEAKGPQAQLVFTSSQGLQWIRTTGAEYTGVAGPVPGAVAALCSNQTLYWSQQGRGSIYSVSMDGSSQTSVLVLKAQGSVSGLALDWIHKLLYWTSVETGSVGVGLLDGSAQRRLITGLDKPSAVAVEPLRGLIFWAECGGASQISRADLDGRGRLALVTYAVFHPVALSLDLPRQLLYWIDQGTKSISRVDLDGRHRKTVVESNGYLDRPFGLAVFEGFVYWSDGATGSVCRASKHQGSSFQVLLSNATAPGALVAVQPALQPSGPSLCGASSIDLLSEPPQISCTQHTPAIARSVPTATTSDPTFPGVLSLIVFLSVLLVGVAVWWWREEFQPSRSLTEQSFSLKESQDPLIPQGSPRGPRRGPVKESLVKPDLDGE